MEIFCIQNGRISPNGLLLLLLVSSHSQSRNKVESWSQIRKIISSKTPVSFAGVTIKKLLGFHTSNYDVPGNLRIIILLFDQAPKNACQSFGSLSKLMELCYKSKQ